MSNAWISKKARYAIYARDNYECCYCGKRCFTGKGVYIKDLATLDHIVARVEIAKGCETDKEFNAACRDAKNLVCVCMACNASKQETPLNIWCAIKGFDYNAIMAEIKRRIA